MVHLPSKSSVGLSGTEKGSQSESEGNDTVRTPPYGEESSRSTRGVIRIICIPDEAPKIIWCIDARHLWCSSRSDDTHGLWIDDAPSSVKLEMRQMKELAMNSLNLYLETLWRILGRLHGGTFATLTIVTKDMCNMDGQTLIGCTMICETRTSLAVIVIVVVQNSDMPISTGGPESDIWGTFPGCTCQCRCSGGSQNQMHSTVSADNITNLSCFQPKRRIFEWLLHLSSSEETQVPSFIVRRAIGVDLRQLRELLMRSIDFRLEASENADSFILRTRNGRLGNVNGVSNTNVTTFFSPLSNLKVACYPCALPRGGWHGPVVVEEVET